MIKEYNRKYANKNKFVVTLIDVEKIFHSIYLNILFEHLERIKIPRNDQPSLKYL